VKRPRALIFLLNIIAFGTRLQVQAAEWPAISKEELTMNSDPSNPGAAAIILYREVNTDDVKGLETQYRRIKVLTDEGKKYGDVEIPYIERLSRIENIQARTTNPDGTAVNFQGQIFDRTVVKTRKTRVQEKAFSLPEVRKGSILEYSYTIHALEKASDVLVNPQDYTFSDTLVEPSATWLVQEELFTRRARFSVHPFPKVTLQWILSAPRGTPPPNRQADGSTMLEMENVPAFQTEELMPPENWLKSRVSFYYLLGPLYTTYWGSVAGREGKLLAPFLGDPKKLKPVVASIVSAADPPETQLRKLYERAQKIRYLAFEPAKTEQEAKRENLKENKSVEDVLKHQYAYGSEINLVMVALARAAGFESAPVRVSSRDRTLFTAENPTVSQLNANVVWVRAASKDYFLDPATRYCPFGLLPWAETATSGILLKEGPFPFQTSSGEFTSIVTTPRPTSNTAVLERRVVLQLDSDGAVQGSLAVSFVGQEALERRIAAANMDEAGRKKALEQEVKAWLPATAAAQLQGPVNWEQADQPLRATFDVKVPDFAEATGRRLLLRAGFFESTARSFQSPTRVHDIYFAHPYREVDDVLWKLPAGYRVRSVPGKQENRTILGNYVMAVENTERTLHSERQFSVEAVYLPASYYAAIRFNFNLARQGDEGQVVLESTGAQDAKTPQ